MQCRSAIAQESPGSAGRTRQRGAAPLGARVALSLLLVGRLLPVLLLLLLLGGWAGVCSLCCTSTLLACSRLLLLGLLPRLLGASLLLPLLSTLVVAVEHAGRQGRRRSLCKWRWVSWAAAQPAWRGRWNLWCDRPVSDSEDVSGRHN